MSESKIKVSDLNGMELIEEVLLSNIGGGLRPIDDEDPPPPPPPPPPICGFD